MGSLYEERENGHCRFRLPSCHDLMTCSGALYMGLGLLLVDLSVVSWVHHCWSWLDWALGLWQPYFVLSNLHCKAVPQCRLQVWICSKMFGITDSICDCNRRRMRHSQSVHRALPTTERADDFKYYARVTNVRTCLCQVNSKLDSTLIIYFDLQYACFLHAIWHALVCKMDVCIFYVICFGVENECLSVQGLFADRKSVV